MSEADSRIPIAQGPLNCYGPQGELTRPELITLKVYLGGRQVVGCDALSKDGSGMCTAVEITEPCGVLFRSSASHQTPNTPAEQLPGGEETFKLLDCSLLVVNFASLQIISSPLWNKEDQKPQNLSNAEARILEELLRKQNQTRSREELFATYNNSDTISSINNLRVVDVHIRRIRDKLGDKLPKPRTSRAKFKIIEQIYRRGYIIRLSTKEKTAR